MFKTIRTSLQELVRRDFWRSFLPLALPIVLQQLLISSMNLVDTLMVGSLGDNAIASVGVAGQLSFFINILLFGVSSGGAIFVSQYWGAKDKRGIHRSFGVMLILNVPLALIMWGICFFAPKAMISIFTDEGGMIAEGSRYLKIACFAYIGVSLSQTMSTVLRSTENVRLPMYASIISSALNAALNYLLIFGKLGFPAMGITGAALGTVIAALLNPLLLLGASLVKKTVIIAPPREIFNISRSFFKHYILRALPVLANEGLWSLGILGCNMVLGRMGEENYAALTICRTIEDLAFVFFVGMCHACNILVGKRVGAGDIEEAKNAARRFMLLEPMLSIVLGALIITLRPAVLSLFSVSDAVYKTAMSLLLVYGFETGLRNIPYVAIVGIFRAGGDTKSGLLYDMLCLYGISLPIVILTGVFLKLPFLTVYILMLLCEDIPKTILCLRRFRSMKWIQPVTGIQ